MAARRCQGSGSDFFCVAHVGQQVITDTAFGTVEHFVTSLVFHYEIYYAGF